jgi:glycine/D-amino acid oxidase-like deaminating enzyme
VHYDVVIAGGAAVGAAVAWHILAVDGGAKKIAVIERDKTFQNASTGRSAASIRQQFSTPENIRLSQYGLEFLGKMAARQGPQADPGLNLGGYLILAGQAGLAGLQDNQRKPFPGSIAVALPPAPMARAARAGSTPMRCCNSSGVICVPPGCH